MYFADAMLGRLAKWLRAIGCDTLYEHDIDDGELVERAGREGRLILTRDTALAESLGPGGCLFVTDNDPLEQLRQVVRDLGIRVGRDDLFSRCLECNGAVVKAAPEEVPGEVPDYVLATCRAFTRCTGCGRVFWPGTHMDRMLQSIVPVLVEAGALDGDEPTC